MARNSSKESTARLFNRYVWLVDLIYRHNNRITFEQINAKWLNSELNSSGEELPLKTFHNHKTAIGDMFDIDIECDRKNGYTYYVDNASDMERGGARQWLINTFAVNNLINESHKLKDRILFEHIPSGQHFLTMIIEAMRDNCVLEITYHSFYRSSASTFEVEPYCVKIFRQRWYLVAGSDKGIRIYALDRIENLVRADRVFVMPEDFEPKNYFYNSFGIIADQDTAPERVEIKVFSFRDKCKYIESLPLHHSQEVVEKCDDYTVFSYYLRPTFYCRQELLSHGDEL